MMISFGALNELSEMKFLALEFFRNADRVCSVESGVFDEKRIPNFSSFGQRLMQQKCVLQFAKNAL